MIADGEFLSDPQAADCELRRPVRRSFGEGGSPLDHRMPYSNVDLSVGCARCGTTRTRSQRMKIVSTCVIAERGHALFTDQAFSWELCEQLKAKKKLKFTDGARTVEIDIKSAEAAITERGKTLAFLVPAVDEEATRDFIVGREYQFV